MGLTRENGLAVTVLRGAPCGATWEAAQRIDGLSPEAAVQRIGLETQFFCTADPAGWDPLWGRSPVHVAGRLHAAALRDALERAGKMVAAEPSDT